MIFRFSLYGFLKNLRFFEPFLILYFLSRGLNFFQISILISFREILINILEIPTGTFADMFGKRRSMILSFFAYIISFSIFATVDSFPFFFPAFAFFALGDAFRTGTHKAIIFDYLRDKKMEDQKTRIYGFTRSWSKLGSALSAVIAAIIMFFSTNYNLVFLASIIPYIINIINFLGYPRDRVQQTGESKIKLFWSEFLGALKLSLRNRPLKKLLICSMSYEGIFAITKEYLQPIVKAFALSLPLFLFLDNHRRTALLIGVVYVVIYLVSSVSSRSSYRFEKKANIGAMRLIMSVTIIFHLLISLFLKIELEILPILLFLGLYVFQNIWRPITVARINENSPAEKTATILSIESQSKSFFIFLFAPLFGYLIDHLGLYTLGFISALFLFLPFIYIMKKKGIDNNPKG